MNREDFKKHIKSTYSVLPDNPFSELETEVFRHQSNKKWFALLMQISKRKLGLDSDEIIDVVNLKCDTLMIGSVRLEKGVYPAYHMNKQNWITVALDNSADDDLVKMLVDMSYELTMPKPKLTKEQKAQKRQHQKKEQLERIAKMEYYFDTVSQALESNPDSITDDIEIVNMIEALKNYTDSGLWLLDFKADEANKLPKDLKRGVLSEDGLYNLLMSL